MKMFTKLFFAIAAIFLLGSTAIGQITQRGSATNATTVNTSLTISKPAGVVSGDVMIVNIAQGGNNTTNPVLAGWTIVDGVSLAGGTLRYGSVFYRVADGTEGASFTFTLGSGVDAAAGSIVAFSGVDVTGGVKANGSAGGPFDVDPGVINVSASSSTATALTLTTATANAAIIMFAEAAGSAPTWSAWTTTSPGALTELYDNPNASGTQASVGAAWAIKAAAGSTGNGTVTLSGGAQRNGGILVALKRLTNAAPAVSLTPSTPQNIFVGATVSFTATASNFAGSGDYTFTWNAVGATIPGTNPNTIPGAVNSDTKILTFPTAGIFTVNVTIARAGAGTLTTGTTTVTVNTVPVTPNLWATSTNGTRISSFIVANGLYVNGPTDIFTPTFPGTTTGGTSTAALGKNAAGFFYWLPNTTGNSGVVEIFAATSTGATPTRIASVDVNGGSANSLGFVRLGMGPDGNGWLLAGDGTNLYLGKFLSNGINPVTIVTVPVVLNGGLVSTFQNGDLCVAGNNSLYALANNGSGVTQIFIGSLNSATVTLTKQWDLVDETSVPFTGTVNGVAFDAAGSLYVTTGTGLYFIDQTTVNGPAATVQCALVRAQTGLQDLASNFFPSGSTLPVTLINFLGSYRNQNTTLSWETENLLNFSHFEIERSTNGINYTSVGSKNPQGNGTTRTQYQFIDNMSAVTGSIFYYRLKMVDADNKFKYSNVILIKKDLKSASGVVLNPNPIVNGAKASANFMATTNSTISFRVIDMSGKLMMTQQNNVVQGNNSVTINNLDRLQSGMYMLQMNDGQSVSTAKFYIVK